MAAASWQVWKQSVSWASGALTADAWNKSVAGYYEAGFGDCVTRSGFYTDSWMLSIFMLGWRHYTSGQGREEEDGLGVFWRGITSAHEYYEVVGIYYAYCPISWPELPSNPKFSYFRSMEHRLGPLGSEHFPVCLAVYYYYSFTEHPSQLALHRHPNAFMAAIITILRGALQKWALANGSTVGCRSWRCTCMQSQCLYYNNSSAGGQRRRVRSNCAFSVNTLSSVFRKSMDTQGEAHQYHRRSTVPPLGMWRLPGYRRSQYWVSFTSINNTNILIPTTPPGHLHDAE